MVRRLFAAVAAVVVAVVAGAVTRVFVWLTADVGLAAPARLERALSVPAPLGPGPEVVWATALVAAVAFLFVLGGPEASPPFRVAVLFVVAVAAVPLAFFGSVLTDVALGKSYLGEAYAVLVTAGTLFVWWAVVTGRRATPGRGAADEATEE
jgi:hypothetical protein